MMKTSPNVGDIDGDGQLDVVVGGTQIHFTNKVSKGYLHAWDIEGNLKSGFPLVFDFSINSVTRLIDVDGDGASEILLHAGDSKLYLVNGDGSVLSGWPADLQGEQDDFLGLGTRIHPNRR